MKFPFILLLFVTSCLIVTGPEETFEMPPVETLPEERNVLVAWPIEPVDIAIIN